MADKTVETIRVQLLSVGLSPAEADELIRNNNLCEAVVKFIQEQGGQYPRTETIVAKKYPELLLFGPNDWQEYYDLEASAEIRPLIAWSKLEKILAEACPFTPGRTVGETHDLFCLPEKIRQKNLDWNSLEKFLKSGKNKVFRLKPEKKGSIENSYSFLWKPNGSWVLIYRGIAAESRGKVLEIQRDTLPKNWIIPTAGTVYSWLWLSRLVRSERSAWKIWGRVINPATVSGGFDAEVRRIALRESVPGEIDFFFHSLDQGNPNIGAYAIRRLED